MSLSYFWVFILLLTAGAPVIFALLIGPRRQPNFRR